jgi:hypothetical protein
MKVFRGDNPTQLYFDSMLSVLTEGEEHAPRGKKIKELRPVCFEFTNPLNRTPRGPSKWREDRAPALARPAFRAPQE